MPLITSVGKSTFIIEGSNGTIIIDPFNYENTSLEIIIQNHTIDYILLTSKYMNNIDGIKKVVSFSNTFDIPVITPNEKVSDIQELKSKIIPLVSEFQIELRFGSIEYVQCIKNTTKDQDNCGYFYITIDETCLLYINQPLNNFEISTSHQIDILLSPIINAASINNCFHKSNDVIQILDSSPSYFNPLVLNCKNQEEIENSILSLKNTSHVEPLEGSIS